MRRWNLLEKYCEIARQHHADEFDPKNLLLALVRLANKTCWKLGTGLVKESLLILSATPESEVLRLSEVDLANLEIFLEDTPVFG